MTEPPNLVPPLSHVHVRLGFIESDTNERPVVVSTEKRTAFHRRTSMLDIHLRICNSVKKIELDSWFFETKSRFSRRVFRARAE